MKNKNTVQSQNSSIFWLENRKNKGTINTFSWRVTCTSCTKRKTNKNTTHETVL